jgi:alcohol dehydrogenase
MGEVTITGFVWVKPSGSDLDVIAQMINDGKIRMIIDRVYSMKAVRQAHEYMESGLVRGKIVIDIERG